MEKIICSFCGMKNNSKRVNCYMCGKNLNKKEEINAANNEDFDVKIYKIKNENDYDMKIYKSNENEDNQINDFSKIKNSNKKRISVITIGLIIIFILIISYICFRLYKTDIEDVKDSVVKIVVYDNHNNELATGSGFCVFENKLIATNFHVIEGGYKIEIITDENKKFLAENILIFNMQNDLALLEINTNLKPLSIVKKENLKAGQQVTAIGSPIGILNTVSTGIISNADDNFEIRITAPISHGSSGGVLLNENNKVIGITYAGYDSNEAQNINYAINSKYLINLYDNFKSKKYTKIMFNTYSKYLGNIESLNILGIDKKINYRADKIDTFYSITNIRSRFEALLERINSKWYSIYNNLNEDQKKEVIEIIKLINEYNFKQNYSSGDIRNWSSMEFLINLNFLKKYEFAIATVKTKYSQSMNDEFNIVNDMPLSVGVKMILLKVLGNYSFDFERSKSTSEQLVNYIMENCDRCRGEILEYLGFNIKYNSNGTFNIYYRY